MALVYSIITLRNINYYCIVVYVGGKMKVKRPKHYIRIQQNYTNFIAFHIKNGFILGVLVFHRPLVEKCLYRRGKQHCLDHFRSQARSLHNKE